MSATATSRTYGAATRCTATASKSRAASTVSKRSKKPAAGELRASWCRPSRPLHRCPRNICRKGGKAKSSKPARDGGKLYARMWAPALGVEEDAATGSACSALVGRWHRSPILPGRTIVFRSSKVSRWGVEAKLKRRLVRVGTS
ncbi:MAG: hypothetical protein DME29_09680 [Verrucomicrobia bacterium]|nr:MAG: hypothetical protein DME29_09680 [Verrucomicrobiota bacterium]